MLKWMDELAIPTNERNIWFRNKLFLAMILSRTCTHYIVKIIYSLIFLLKKFVSNFESEHSTKVAGQFSSRFEINHLRAPTLNDSTQPQ